jgi:hypothetical protein
VHTTALLLIRARGGTGGLQPALAQPCLEGFLSQVSPAQPRFSHSAVQGWVGLWICILGSTQVMLILLFLGPHLDTEQDQTTL